MEPIFTAAEFSAVRAYHDPRYVASAVDFFVTPMVFAAMVRWATSPLARITTGWGAALERRGRFAMLTRLWGGPGWAGALLFAWLFFGLYGLTGLPVAVAFGYFHERAHGLSHASPAVFSIDLLKGELVFAAAVGALVFGLFGLARRTKQWWWLLGLSAAVLTLFATAIDPYRSRVYVEQTPLEAGRLRTKLLELLGRANVEVADVLIEKTASRSVRLQAYFAGKGPTRTIILSDSLVSTMSEPELLAAVAHEAGHVHERRWPGELGAALALLLVLWAIERLFVIAPRRGWFGVTERADVRLLPLIALLFSLAMIVTTPASAAVSRQRELDADRFAVALLADDTAFRSMLVKAARTNKMDPEPPRWVVLRGMSHPPIMERLCALDSGGP